jgi:hypothetical protein
MRFLKNTTNLHMKKPTVFLAFLLLFILPASFAQTYTTGVVSLSSTAGLAMTAKIDVGTQVTLTLTGPSGRWFALGFNASSMANGTDVVGVHSATTLSAFDCKLTGYVAPVTDAQQNWSITSDAVNGGIRTIVATRALNTGDANDYIFPATPTAISLIWARSGTASFNYSNHGGTNRGITSASFTLVPPPTPPAAPTGAANQTLCAGATVSQLSATGTAIQWYATQTGGTPLASNTVMVNGTTYYATQTVNGLESTNRLAVTITLNNIPAAPTTIVGNLDFCYSGGVQLFNTPSIQDASSYVWNTPVGATGSSTGTNISLIFSPSFVSGSLSVLAQNSCGQSAPISVVINQHLQASTTLNVTTCGSFPWNGQTLWTSGVYVDSLQTAGGCDSVVLLNLNVYPIYAVGIDSSVFDAFTWNGIEYASSGSYTQFFTSINGCDSSVTINLTIEDSGLDENTTSYLAYPNPVTDGSLWISGLNNVASYQIWDTQGRLLKVGTTVDSISIGEEITNGTYLLLINEQRLRFQVCKH